VINLGNSSSLTNEPMFHVEHFMKMLKFMALLSVLFAFTGCQGPDPLAYLKDPLYQEIEKDMKAAQGEIAETEKAVVAAQADLKSATPQTGQIKYAKKKLFEAEYRSRMANQRLVALTIQLDSQKWIAKEESLLAIQNKKEWPTKDALELYNLQKQLILNDRDWSYKKRRTALGFPNRVEVKDGAPAKIAAPEKPKEGN
jgi:hypothetical protein